MPTDLMQGFHVERLVDGPIIYPELHPSILENINGPSLIRVPTWVENALGRYYLYFAHHAGRHIRLAYADDLKGPWKIHVPGALNCMPKLRHIASPDVHINESTREFRLYYHGKTPGDALQKTWLARSADGLHFASDPTPMGPSYFRVFNHGGEYFTLAKQDGGRLFRSFDGVTSFESGPLLLTKMRHAATWHRGDHVLIAYSRIGDSPERLFLCRLELRGDWKTWRVGDPVELLRPERAWEGGNLPVSRSRSGPIHEPANQLRDPAFYHEEDRTYLLYSVAGERGIAIARLHHTL